MLLSPFPAFSNFLFLRIRKRNQTQFSVPPSVTDLSSLDEERLSQCVWYLRTYARPRHIVSFYVKHGLFGQACAVAAERDIGAAVRWGKKEKGKGKGRRGREEEGKEVVT